MMRCHLLVAIVLFAASCATAAAQARSRVDLQLGAWFVEGVRPGVVMGATGWMGDRSGVAVRGFLVPGWRSRFGPRVGNERGFEAMYRDRGSVRDFETDFGIGLLFSKWAIEQPDRAREASNWWSWLTMDFLVGRRIHERYGVQAGLACRMGSTEHAEAILKFMVVAPLGSR